LRSEVYCVNVTGLLRPGSLTGNAGAASTPRSGATPGKDQGVGQAAG